MDYLTLIILTVITFLSIRWLLFRKLDKLEKLGIPHPKPWPIFGNMASPVFGFTDMASAFQKVYKIHKTTNYVGMYEFHESAIIIKSPELIKNITVKNFDHFVDHRVDLEADELFSKNLMSLRGDHWRKIRAILSPAFTSSKMKSMFKLMWSCGENFANFFAERSSNAEIEIDMKEAMTRYTNDVIGTCAFGISIDSVRNPTNTFYLMGKKITSFDRVRVIKIFFARSFPKLASFFGVKFMEPEVENFFTNAVRETIEMRDREGITRPDMIQLMMETRGKMSEEGQELTILDMTAQALVFFFGGFESSATCMSFAAHLIAAHEEVQKKLHEEIYRVLKDTNELPSYEAINGMQYLDAVINETLRLYPVQVAVDRVCVKAYELPPALPNGKPVIIEPGQTIWIPIYPLHRDPKYFEDPDKFEPERFIDERKNDIKPFTYLPFGVGPRMCIANRFALLETKVVLFQLLSKCNLKLNTKTKFPFELAREFVMKPKEGFWLRVQSRNRTCEKSAAI